ncbi:hypothetical protein BWI15_34935 [Kribbella sp. ALI-6-A]|nr:hypothetical protein BWI15_34935 [Kribbella sp. ALI-6-A]
MTAAAHAEAEQAVVRQQQSKLLLTDQDRSVCSTALSEQVGLGRIDMAELHRRTELLYAAKTRADLEPVFLGLPRPQLHGEQIEPKRRTWRWVVFGVAAGMSVPFLLSGLLFLLAGSDAGDRGFGAFLTVGAVLWTLFAFGWVRRGRSRRT